MIKTLRKLIMGSALLGLFIMPFMAPTVAFAAAAAGATSVPLTNTGLSNCGAGGAIDVDPTQCTGTENGAGTTVNNITTLAINIFSIVVGLICVVMIIVGGLKYVTSNGDTGNVSGAKNTILYAVVGLVIVALAQLIVKFVLNKANVAGGA